MYYYAFAVFDLAVATWNLADGQWVVGVSLALFAVSFAIWPGQRKTAWISGYLASRHRMFEAGLEARDRNLTLTEFLLAEAERDGVLARNPQTSPE